MKSKIESSTESVSPVPRLHWKGRLAHSLMLHLPTTVSDGRYYTTSLYTILAITLILHSLYSGSCSPEPKRPERGPKSTLNMPSMPELLIRLAIHMML